MKLPNFVCKVTFLLGSLEVICILLIAIRRSCIFIVLRPRDGIVRHSMSWVLIEDTFIINKLFYYNKFLFQLEQDTHIENLSLGRQTISDF